MFLKHLGRFSVENIFWNISNFWNQIFENKNRRVVGLHVLYDPQVLLESDYAIRHYLVTAGIFVLVIFTLAYLSRA